MKVLDESGKGIEAGAALKVADLGLPVDNDRATLMVFWKRR
jgi:hypothetical protein